MNTLFKYAKFIPYLYFITIVAFWFTDVNQNEGIVAYPILLLGIPFLWQLIKPNEKLNLTLGLVFVCLSSYMIIAYLSKIFGFININNGILSFLFYGGMFVIGNFLMALWIVKNSLHRNI
ncbi:hypothetical protein FJ651_01185 [Paucihalobacter ruber]|uniref:Uncharacterized protein n=1 Tax=Paucihalobacter ruber TaxID=2567861 RepID=A0A506PNR6_9FLAO|nr:hypothetical protein [Paucihalobacter ruber]TPV35556.1 hypothetical protein FJ651_01185 [Paucihalobacter ruber]